jgi:hypothetical protein
VSEQTLDCQRYFTRHPDNFARQTREGAQHIWRAGHHEEVIGDKTKRAFGTFKNIFKLGRFRAFARRDP